MESPALDSTIFLLARILEFANIGVIILFANKNVPARYIYYVLAITVFSISFFILSLFIRGLALVLSLFVTLGAFAIMLVFAYRVLKSSIVDVDVQEGARCAVCSAFIKKSDGTVALRVGNQFIFFDRYEHLKGFLENFEDYVKLRKLDIKWEDVKEAYKWEGNSWRVLDIDKGSGV